MKKGFVIVSMVFLAGVPLLAVPTVSNVQARITGITDNGKGMKTRTFVVTFDLANTNGKSCRIFPGVQGVEKAPVLQDEGPYLWFKNVTGDTAAAAGTGKQITFTVADTAGEFDNCRVKITAWDRDGWAPWPNRTQNPRHHAWALDVRQGTVHPHSASFISWIKANSIGAFLSVLFQGDVFTVMGNHAKGAPTITGGESDTNSVPFPAVSLGDPADVFQEGQTSPSSSCNGDCILEVVDVENWVLYNIYGSNRNGSGPYAWSGANLAVFPYYSETYLKKAAGMVLISGEKPSTIGGYRTIGWTSSSASGLAYSAGYVMLHEVNDGEINHALRFETLGSRPYYVHPATHCAGAKTDTFAAPAGLRLRLKSTWDINSHIPLTGTPGTTAYRDCRAGRIILRAIQKYGMIWEDNCGYGGGYLTGETDNHTDLKWTNLGSGACAAQYLYMGLSIDNFEVVDWKWQYDQYSAYEAKK